jgi:hypothetical protein
MKADPLKPPLTLLCKLASVAVHAEEMLSANGHPYDELSLRTALQDAEVVAWLKAMGPFVPVKR